MGALEVGQRLVALCNEGKNLDAINELYADGVVSVEASDSPDGTPREMAGIEAVRGKNEWWVENHEIHGGSVEGPFMHGDDRFAAIFHFDVTSKPMGNQRMQLHEVGVFTVDGGKVVREEFYYTMM